ncbi:hypothetical protein Pan44_39940 [Caulifigura coniformis]|uniref:DUF2779 domain-containing protein n=1 Tax=Caulifigura coniformis TaxID=2527983 RepID=A0A517SIM5_9PLAN|nr:DUF2779 domain-containing protein [Caulifigura coniformis]QDT55946.1 hypothetical protein Pan44_39940 [Caulifigura coniformis]
MSIRKKTVLDCRTCATMGWVTHRSQRDSTLTLAERFRIDEGNEIGVRARGYFAGGTLVEDLGIGPALVRTRAIIADGQIDTIFEAAFEAGEFVARVDVLRRTADGWHVIEVKSSLDPKDEHVDDLAYSVAVATASGLNVVQASLMLLSRDFRNGQSDSELFALHDRSAEVRTRQAALQNDFGRIAEQVLGETQPAPELTVACKGCDYFPDCLGADVTTPIFRIPRLTGKKLETLLRDGILELSDIPVDFVLTAPQARFVEVMRTGKAHFDVEDAQAFLAEISWPAHYLDFETATTCVPLYDGLAPHEQFVTQYSLHVCDSLGNIIHHREHLAEHSCDGRRELIERLIDDLGERGSIVVYSHFEKTMLGKLSLTFPEYAPAVGAIVDRLFDLEPLFKNFLTHPRFGGRTSIKAILPVLTTLSYDGLEVADGSHAMAAFAMLAKGRLLESESGELRNALLKYCCQDTLAMVRLHEAVHRIASGELPMPE